jgi:hypothetical protein
VPLNTTIPAVHRPTRLGPAATGYAEDMTTSPREPLEWQGPRSEDTAAEDQNERDEELVAPESELAEGGYDDRQESPEAADADLFARKEQDPDARYRHEDLPKSEPRKQPRNRD